jgi:hypothetical protein
MRWLEDTKRIKLEGQPRMTGTHDVVASHFLRCADMAGHAQLRTRLCVVGWVQASIKTDLTLSITVSMCRNIVFRSTMTGLTAHAIAYLESRALLRWRHIIRVAIKANTCFMGIR